MEIGKSYFLSIKGIPYHWTFWKDNFIFLGLYHDGKSYDLYNIRLARQYLFNKDFVEVIHENI